MTSLCALKVSLQAWGAPIFALIVIKETNLDRIRSGFGLPRYFLASCYWLNVADGTEF